MWFLKKLILVLEYSLNVFSRSLHEPCKYLYFSIKFLFIGCRIINVQHWLPEQTRYTVTRARQGKEGKKFLPIFGLFSVKIQFFPPSFSLPPPLSLLLPPSSSLPPSPSLLLSPSFSLPPSPSLLLPPSFLPPSLFLRHFDRGLILDIDDLILRLIILLGRSIVSRRGREHRVRREI